MKVTRNDIKLKKQIADNANTLLAIEEEIALLAKQEGLVTVDGGMLFVGKDLRAKAVKNTVQKVSSARTKTFTIELSPIQAHFAVKRQKAGRTLAGW